MITDELNNPSHEGRWHEGLGRKLTEHELDSEDLTEWQKNQTTEKWIVWESGTRFWDGDGAPDGRWNRYPVVVGDLAKIVYRDWFPGLTYPPSHTMPGDIPSVWTLTPIPAT